MSDCMAMKKYDYIRRISMTSKERVEYALSFKEADRMPFNFWMDRRMLEDYDKKFGEDFRVNHYDADVIEVFPILAWPEGESEMRDGTCWRIKPLLEDWSKADELVMPEVTEDTYADIRRNLEKYPDKAVFVNIPGPFTILNAIRLLDNVYYDVYDYPEEMHRLIKRIMDIQNEVIKEIVKMPITAVYFQDDIASSKGVMLAPQMLDEFVFDYFKEGIAAAKAAGKFVVFHSDGNVTDVLDRLVELGINAVNPLQPEFNDFEAFKKKYHRRLAVYGGMDNTKIIPLSTAGEVRAHVRDVYNKLGAGGGLILSSHDIPIYCPQENVDAMVEEILSL